MSRRSQLSSLLQMFSGNISKSAKHVKLSEQNGERIGKCKVCGVNGWEQGENGRKTKKGEIRERERKKTGKSARK